MFSKLRVLSVVGIMMVALAGILILPATAVAQDGWTWQHPLPQGNSLYGIWGSSADNVFAVGYRGTIVRYDGTTWSTMTSGTLNNLFDVWGSSGTDVFAVGYWGTILHYDGTTWSKMSSGVTNTLRDVWGSSGSDIFAVGDNGAIVHYDGANWTPMASGVSSYFVGVWGSSGSDVFAVAATGAVLHYDGSGWSPLPTDTATAGGVIAAIWGSSEGIYAVTTSLGGPALRYTGTGWEAIGSVDLADGIWGTSGSDIFVVGYNGAIWRYDGSDWLTATETPGLWLHAVWGSSASDVFAVGDGGLILHFDGIGWTNTLGVTTKGVYDVWGSSGCDVYAVGQDATIMHYDGTRWATMPGRTDRSLAGIWGASSSDVYAVGAANDAPSDPNGAPSGLILHYDGSSWTTMDSGTHGYFVDIWGSSTKDIFAIGYASLIMHFDGVEWSQMVVDTAGIEGVRLTAIWGSSSSDVFAVGACCQVGHSGGNGVWLHYDGHTWSKVTRLGVDPLADVWGSSSKDVYAVGGMIPSHRPAGATAIHYDGVKWDDVAIPQSDPYEDLTAVWGSGSDDVFVAGNGWMPIPSPVPSEPTMWHYDGTTWTATRFFTSAPSAGWANSKTDVFAVGGQSILHYGAPQQPLLTVIKGGNGSGVVTSSPAGITCGSSCNEITQTLEYCAVMTLAATADAGSVFTGWSGACSGTGPCAPALDAAKVVTATFGVEGAVTPQGRMMYYGQQLEVRQGVAASTPLTATQLVIFTGSSVPQGLYLMDVEGTESYSHEVSAARLINRLLQTGCAGTACDAVNCAYYSPDGKRTDIVVTDPITSDHLYLPLTKR